ncbi:LOW QUALITY PROTEIN: rho guanine nucleotide exchange factor 38 [Bombina bombina]|uniref:LOW QUALITY PROTEIN: rho guanine nucleotide exchange factor 38 n=1 Tax=Bombina bombina TaxID=8345 RepID=UPI00235AB440|nr:LOW QUALITY PROTEIN: rho guanine nucleotide exchange factor 38 [Bombina bombina]
MDIKELGGKDSGGIKKRNLTFLKSRLYMLERRKTDTIVEHNPSGDHATLRRSQSDRTEYNQKLKEKMTPNAILSAPTSPTQDTEELQRKKMEKRSKILAELIQTERDYLNDLELCIREVVQPLQKHHSERFDVDVLFSNIESVCQISAKLVSLLEEATTDVDPEHQVIGDVFLEIKGPLEDVYKIYCYHHDEAHSVLESYEKDEELKQYLRHCIQALKKIYEEQGKPNLLDIGSLMIKPIQRVMKYPLLLCELVNATPASHPDYRTLQDAFTAVRDMNVNINELKRRKDLVLKYRRADEEESLKDKLSKLSIHSITKKSKRVTSHLKLLTGRELQVKDQIFNKEEKIFRSLEKTVRFCVKNISYTLQHMQDAMPGTEICTKELQNLLHDENLGSSEELHSHSNTESHYECFASKLTSHVMTPLSILHAMFPMPQKLIQKRYDKLLDYHSCLQRPGDAEMDQARKVYEALNAQLVEELQTFNKAARSVLGNCLYFFITIMKDILSAAKESCASYADISPQLPANVNELQQSIYDGLQNLNFFKDNSSATFIERKLSFEKKKTLSPMPELPRQNQSHRCKLLSTYGADKLYQAKRKCNATQELDIDLYEGELVAIVEHKDPLGSTSRWFVDTGIRKGYVYSSFLKPYNPGKVQKDLSDNSFCDDDFDNISLFVSSRPPRDQNRRTSVGSASDSSPSINGDDEKHEINEADADSCHNGDDYHIFYAVYSFEARCQQELSLKEHQRVRIIRFCDLSGNKEWWFAEAHGQKGYVPANYLGKMTYA